MKLGIIGLIAVGFILLAIAGTFSPATIHRLYWLPTGQLVLTRQSQGSLGLLTAWTVSRSGIRTYHDLPQGVLVPHGGGYALQSSVFQYADPVCCPSGFSYQSIR